MILKQTMSYSDRENSRFTAIVFWALAVSFIFYKYMLEVSPSVMTHELMHAYHVGGASLGNAVACYYYSYLLMQIPVGILLDRYGPRMVGAAGIFICVMGVACISYASTLFVFGVGRFILGAGAAVSILGAFKLISIWFPENRFAFFAGLTMTVGILGAVFGERPLAIFVDHVGWRHALFHLSVAGLIFCLLYFIVIRDNGPYSLRDEGINSRSVMAGLKSVMCSKQSWILSIYSGLMFSPMTAFAGLWGVPFLETSFGFTKPVAAQSVSMIFVGFSLGAPVFGWLSDKIGLRKPFLWFSSVFAISVFCIVVFSNSLSLWGLDVLLFIFGLVTSSFMISFTMIRELNPLIFVATSIAFMNAFNALIGAIADPLLGHVLDATWSGAVLHGARVYSLSVYHQGMMVLVIYLAAALVLIPFIKETHCKQQA